MPVSRASAASRPYILLGALLVVSVIFQVRLTWDVGRGLIEPELGASLPFGVPPASKVIRQVSDSAAKAGLRAGDEIAAINGVAYRGRSSLAAVAANGRTGDAVQVTVRRKEGPLTLALRLEPERRRPFGRSEEALVQVVLYLVMPWFSLLVGFWVTFVRPRDPQAWLVLALMMAFPRLPRVDLMHWEDWIRSPAILYQAVLVGALPVALLLFAIYFAERFRWDLRFPWLKWLLIVPLAASVPVDALYSLLLSENWAAAAAIAGLARPVRGFHAAAMFASIGLYFFVLGWNRGIARGSDARRRLRMLLIGTNIAMMPMFLVITTGLFLGREILGGFPPWVLTTSLMFLFLFPLTLAYVIVVHKALDVGVVVRQGIQYALARGASRAVAVLAAAVILFVSISLAMDPESNRPRRIAALGGGMLLLMLVPRLGGRLAGWVDRRFFRQAYDAERILTELGENVRTMVETRPLLETVARTISESLFVPRVAMLVRDGGWFRPAYAVGYATAPAVAFGGESVTVKRLAEGGEPARVYLDDEHSWVNTAKTLSAEERGMLEALETQLLLPLAVKDRLLGIMSLGEKKSEEPYSGSDLRLLRAVAGQAGLALENAQLAAAVASEAAQRERIHREMEIAREVQERLLPQQAPPVEGLDCAGYCRPAEGVGGDYYDFIPLADARLGIAIGDVSGKGIAAALLMASLQASVRGQILHPEQSLAATIALVNRLVYESSASHRYATLWYAQVDPATRALEYVNAGHNPPLLLSPRSGGEVEVERLETGGTVVGLLQGFSYEQGRVEMRSGDLLVAFTDGISEAENAAGEDWGEQRLIAAARAAMGGTAAETIRALMEAADAFVAGAPQHDDMTLVVVRVL